MKEHYRVMFQSYGAYLIQREDARNTWTTIDEVSSIDDAKKKLKILRGENDGDTTQS